MTRKRPKRCTCTHGVIWFPLNSTFSSVPLIDSTRGFSVCSSRSVSSIVSEMNFTWNAVHQKNQKQIFTQQSKHWRLRPYQKSVLDIVITLEAISILRWSWSELWNPFCHLMSILLYICSADKCSLKYSSITFF